MTREIKQLERTNKKLKKHNEQYLKIYKDIVKVSNSFEQAPDFKS